MFKLFVCVFISSVFSLNVKASSLDELKMKYVEMIMACSDSYPITAADMVQLKSKTMPDSESTKCLFACVYKKAGMMNEQGELSVEGVNEMTRKYLSDDPVKIKKSEEFTEACKSECSSVLDILAAASAHHVATIALYVELNTDQYESKHSIFAIIFEECTSVLDTLAAASAHPAIVVPPLHLNDVAVSDGERGCERAALIFKCTVEKSPDFDLL